MIQAQVIRKARELLGDDADLVDWDAVTDSSLTLSENLEELRPLLAPYRQSERLSVGDASGYGPAREDRFSALLCVTQERVRDSYKDRGLLVLELEILEEDEHQREYRVLYARRK